MEQSIKLEVTQTGGGCEAYQPRQFMQKRGTICMLVTHYDDASLPLPTDKRIHISIYRNDEAMLNGEPVVFVNGRHVLRASSDHVVVSEGADRLACERAAWAFLAKFIGERFADILYMWSTAEEWGSMRRKNRDEKRVGICHSHDFCDANEAMAQALKEFGFDLSGDFGNDQFMTSLWNAAWDYAKEHRLTATSSRRLRHVRRGE